MKEQGAFDAHASYVLDLCFTTGSQTLISAGMDNVLKLWSAREWGAGAKH
jgi:WD40 repeat protein